MVSGKIGAVVMATTLFAVIGMLFMTPVVDAVNDSTGTQSVTNETITASTGDAVELTGYDLEDGTVTVYGYNDTTDSYETATEGTDYEVDLDSGSVTALEGSSLIDDAEDVKVTYDYQATGTTTTLLAGFVPLMILLLIFVVVAQRTMDIL